MNILIIKLGAIGDVIRTTSILPGLKEKYPDCKISWLTKKESFDILKNNNMINKVYLKDQNLEDEAINNDYDLVISLDDDYNACKLSSELKSKKIIGVHLDNEKETYTQDSSLWFDMGLISKYGKKKGR